MSNGVSTAKLHTLPEKSCNIDDIEYWEDVTHMYIVDDEGYSGNIKDTTDGDFKCYYCNGCDTHFGEGSYNPDTAWKEVKAHFTK